MFGSAPAKTLLNPFKILLQSTMELLIIMTDDEMLPPIRVSDP